MHINRLTCHKTVDNFAIYDSKQYIYPLGFDLNIQKPLVNHFAVYNFHKLVFVVI